MLKNKVASIAFFSAALVSAHAAFAIDIYPGDYTVLPAGVNLGLVYLGYTPSDQLNHDGGGRIPQSSLNQTVGIARILHYSALGGMPVAYQAFLPFAMISDAKVGGAPLATNNGMGDATFGFTAFFLNRPDPKYGTVLGLTTYISLPTGQFDAGKVGAGAGTPVLTPQLGLIQGLGENILLDASFDVAVRHSHDNGGSHFSTRPSYELQTYLRYQFSPQSSVSAGYAGFFGGKQDINGAYAGLKTESSQLRVFASHMLAPTWQLSGMVGKALSTDGGFQNSYSTQLRLMKIF